MQPGITNCLKESSMTKTPPHIPPAHFVAWLEEGKGRAAYFHRVDNRLFPPLISKFKTGEVAITFEYACRLERAQMPSDNPLTAESLMTFLEDRQLYRYITGQEPRPAKVEVVRKPRTSARKLMTPAEA
jgi:hypothetical protein